ncbi:MAG TPA: hypothetical protein GXZ82_13955 [Firmicutes bacterium]|nr:hypothetical protein [Bacillota bacterium]
MTSLWGVSQRCHALRPLYTRLILLSLAFLTLLAIPSGAQAGTLSAAPTPEQYVAQAKRVVRVENTSQLVAAVKTVIPGDVVILADGVYSGDAALSIFNQRGTAKQPIVIIAENQGQAVLKGKLRFDISYSSYVTISGLVFNTQGAGAKGDIGAITIKHSQNNRITRNHFALDEQYGANSSVMLDWVVIRGRQSLHNRIDHNLFENKRQRGRFIIVGVLSGTDVMPQYTRIDHNHFRDMAPLGGNGMEAIVLGGGHPQSAHYMADQDAFSVFEYNLLERVDGECAEFISLKSSSNEIRYNTIIDTNGSIYFRAGNRNAVYGNYFLGHNKPGSGGVRIYGEDQKVMHNYFSELALPAVWFGDANAAFYDPKTNLAPYLQVIRAEVAFNTFINTSLGLARHLRDGCELTPQDSSISNNLLYTAADHKLIDPLLLQEKGITWLGNMAYAAGSSGVEQQAGLNVTEMQVRWINPQLQRSGFYPDYLYSIGEDSPARHAALGAMPVYLTDIEGKPRSAAADVGAYEYAGYPPLRGLLTAQDVGPNAMRDLGPAVLETPGLALTGISLAGDDAGGSWYGPVDFSVTTAGVGLTQPIRYEVQVDDRTPQTFESAAFVLNTGELSDGEHQVRITAYSGDLQDTAHVSFSIANARILAPKANEQVKGGIDIQVESGLPAELIRSVELSVAGTVLYQGAQLPQSLPLQTDTLPDGLHTLELAIQAQAGVAAKASVRFRTANFWRMTTSFTPAGGWFFAPADETQLSAGWRHINDPGDALFGDANRIVRTNNTTESCTWSTPQLTQAVISIYTRTEQLRQQVRVEVSVDGERWQEVAYALKTLGQADDWYELELSVKPPAGLYQHLRLIVSAGDLPVEDIQLGHAVMEGLNH